VKDCPEGVNAIRATIPFSCILHEPLQELDKTRVCIICAYIEYLSNIYLFIRIGNTNFFLFFTSTLTNYFCVHSKAFQFRNEIFLDTQIENPRGGLCSRATLTACSSAEFPLSKVLSALFRKFA